MSTVVSVYPHTDTQIRASVTVSSSKAVRDTFRTVCKSCDFVWTHSIRAYVGNVAAFAAFVDKCTDALLYLDCDPSVAPLLEKYADSLDAERKALQASLDESCLFTYQQEGVQFLTSRTRALLADEMGLGKTVQALFSVPENVPLIVVTPASLKGIWQKEIRKWLATRFTKVFVHEGKESFFPPEEGEAAILNYAITPDLDDWTEVFEDGLTPHTCLIADEIHATKNPKSKRTKRFRLLAKKVVDCGGRVYGLTGTPLLNRPPELWEVLKSLGLEEEAFGDADKYARLFGMYSYEAGSSYWGSPSPKVAKQLSKVALRRHRKDVLPDLPSKLYQTIETDPLKGEALRVCNDVFANELAMEAIRILIEGGKADFGGMGAIMEARKWLAIAKIPKLLELVEYYEYEDTPLVVFSHHRQPVDHLGKRDGWVTITGSTSNKRRSQIETDFQAGKYKGIAGTIGAMSEGLTLTHSHTAIFVDKAWTPARIQQAEDRVCRIGQDKGVNIISLVADHDLDRMIEDILARKVELFNKTVRRLPMHNETHRADSDSSPTAILAARLREIAGMVSG